MPAQVLSAAQRSRVVQVPRPQGARRRSEEGEEESMKKPKPSKPKVPQVSIRGETHAKVKEYCDKKGITVTSFIDKLCKEFLEL